MYTVHSLFANIGKEALYPENDNDVPSSLHDELVKVRNLLNKGNDETVSLKNSTYQSMLFDFDFW